MTSNAYTMVMNARRPEMSNISDTPVPNSTVTESVNSLFLFAMTYARFHGYVSICVCVFGIVTNLFNISVLTRRHMHTPVNQILTWLAVSDILTMCSYVPFAVHFYCNDQDGRRFSERSSRSWLTFMLFHVNLTSTTHTISIWMCVLLAIVRFLHIRKPTKANIFRIRRNHQTRNIICVVYVMAAVLLIPNYMSNEIQEVKLNNETGYELRPLNLGRNDTEPMVLLNVWLYAVTGKLVPCLLMSIFGSLLIYNIHIKVRQRRKVLQISGQNSIRLSEHSRTTKMLLAVIILFLLTELPQGVLIVFSACVPGFFDHVYMQLGDVMDIAALVNNAVNFILYCSMSAKFRQTFVHLYCRKFRRRRTRETGYTLTLTEQIEKYDSHSNNNKMLSTIRLPD